MSLGEYLTLAHAICHGGGLINYNYLLDKVLELQHDLDAEVVNEDLEVLDGEAAGLELDLVLDRQGQLVDDLLERKRAANNRAVSSDDNILPALLRL